MISAPRSARDANTGNANAESASVSGKARSVGEERGAATAGQAGDARDPCQSCGRGCGEEHRRRKVSGREEERSLETRGEVAMMGPIDRLSNYLRWPNGGLD